jgi:hypothetical protein
MKKQKNYLDRLEEINKDYGKRTVFESIDKPIRNLVYHMNRIGLKTRFSCCGFPYLNEEEPKSHYKGAYVMFYTPNPEQYQIFFDFMNTARMLGWTTFLLNPNEWSIRKRRDLPEDYYKPDEIEYAIHDYEGIAIAIQSLEFYIKKLPTANKDFSIIDGNKEVKEFSEYWQIEPKQDKKFHVE